MGRADLDDAAGAAVVLELGVPAKSRSFALASPGRENERAARGAQHSVFVFAEAQIATPPRYARAPGSRRTTASVALGSNRARARNEPVRYLRRPEFGDTALESDA